MTGFDIIVLLIVAVAAAGGFMRGFVQEMLSLAAWILALLAIRQFHTQVQALIEPQVGSATTAAIRAAAAAIRAAIATSMLRPPMVRASAEPASPVVASPSIPKALRKAPQRSK